MWALIFSIMQHHDGAIATTTVPNFDTELLCRQAGAQQEVVLRNDFKINTGKKYSFICVKIKD